MRLAALTPMRPTDGAFWVCCIFPLLALEALDLAETATRPLALLNGLLNGSGGRETGDRVGKNAGEKAGKKVGEKAGEKAGGRPRSGQQTVQACNGPAHSEGVVPGMALAAAYSRCPTLLCRDRQPIREAARLAQLADIAYGFTSDVSLVPADGHSPGQAAGQYQNQGLLLECAGSLTLFGGAPALLQSLQHTWQQLGHHCDLSIAHTPLAAQILARARLRLPPDQTSVAERARQALRHVRLAHGPWHPKVVERFSASGLHTFGEVLLLPRAALGRRFGAALLRDLDRLTGALPDPRPAITPRPYFRAGVQLLEDLRHRDGLIFPMHRLLKDLSEWLRLRQLATDAITWRFGDGRRPPISVAVNLSRPSLDVARLLELSKLQLERTGLMPEINTIELQSLNPTRTRAEPLSLFTNDHAGAAGHRQAPAYLLDLFQARLGEEGLRGITLADDHRPELSWRPVAPSFAPTPTAPTPTFAPSFAPSFSPSFSPMVAPLTAGVRDDGPPLGLRPLWLLPKPRRIAAAVGATAAPLQLLRGPERIDVAWWALAEHHPQPPVPDAGAAAASIHAAAATAATADSTGRTDSTAGNMPISMTVNMTVNMKEVPLLAPTVARDYYIARDAQGVLCWVYRTHEGGDWFLHGYFA